MSGGASQGRFFSDEAIWSSSATGWRSAHLRRYRHDREAEVETPPAVDQVLVLVTRGSTLIESFEAGRWRSAAHRPGNIGMTGPGCSDRLRWYGVDRHETLHLHIPAETMQGALADVRDNGTPEREYPDGLFGRDQVIEAVMASLVRAADNGTPDLYAESAAQFLAQHLVARHVRRERVAATVREAGRIRRVEEFMNAHLAADVSLQNLASIAGCSTFQLIRMCKAHWNQTPFERLTRLRMEAARHLLKTTDASVTSIALDCGYANPSHFATAFRRVVGLSPTDYRQT